MQRRLWALAARCGTSCAEAASSGGAGGGSGLARVAAAAASASGWSGNGWSGSSGCGDDAGGGGGGPWPHAVVQQQHHQQQQQQQQHYWQQQQQQPPSCFISGGARGISSLSRLSKLHLGAAAAAAAFDSDVAHLDEAPSSSSGSGDAAAASSSSSSQQQQQGQPAAAATSSSSTRVVDPFALVRGEVAIVSERLRSSILTDVPALGSAAAYFFRPGVTGKRLRPTLLLLLASALADAPPPPAQLDQPDLRPPRERPLELRRRQQRVAEIAELIHVASLLHDDVLDDAATRRGVSSLNAASGDKLAILAGDFLLARASVTLASLQDTEIVELLSRVLEHLVAGEVMQMAASPEQLTSLEHYLEKTYCKTASLMANAGRAVALLGGAPPSAAEAAWQYGRHLGIAFQVVDDLLDLTGSARELGKPALSDLRAGLATAPVLLAAEEQPALLDLIRRKFRRDGDVARALDLVNATRGVERARALAADHARLAAEQVAAFPPARGPHAVAAREALVDITQRVLVRSK